MTPNIETNPHNDPERLFVLFNNSLEACASGHLVADSIFEQRLMEYIVILRKLNPSNLEARLLEPLNQFRDKIPANTFKILWHKISNPI